MEISVKKYLPLFKIKICILITLSAVVGFILTASGDITVRSAISLILVTMFASASASAFNHYFDMDIDAVMERTKRRPIPSGSIVSSEKVLAIAVVLFLLAILLSLGALNYMVALHLFLGAFVYGVLYTVWLKRRSWANIIIGGLAGSFAVLAGGASARPELCLPPLLLALVLFFWTPSHFWSFAIAYREEYKKAGIPMLPVVIGSSKTARYILVNTLFLVTASILPYLFGHLGIFYVIIALIGGAYFLIKNIQLLLDRSKEVAWKNFRASIHYLWLLFIGIIVDVVFM